MEHARSNATGSFGSSASVDAISVERNLQRASCRAREGCALVEACLRHRGGRDHSKAFFERVFPALVGRIVGVQGDAWLNLASEADAEALLKLLRVDGALLQAIRESDVHEEVRFAFPTRWLPKRTQLLLRSEEGCRILGQMPHYACHLAPDGIGGARVQVSLFEYLGFWLAVYATKGSARPSRTGQVATTGIVQEFATAAHFVKDMVTHHQVAGGKPVYQRLLEQLFSDYLSTPTCLSINQAASQGFQGETGGAVFAEYLSASRGGSSSILALGNCLLNILLDFWLSDASDVIDLQLNKQYQGYGTPGQGTSPIQSSFTRHEPISTLASPIRASQSMAAYAYQPPSKDLCNAIRLMVTHFLPQEPETTTQEKVEEATGYERMDPFSPLRPQKLFGSPGRFGTSDPETSSSQGCQTFLPLQKPLYRFLRKAFILWPEETTSSMTPIADIWLTYVTPWRMVSGEWDARFKKRESPSRHQLANVLKTKMSTSPGEKRDGGVRVDQADFSSYWKKYVSQNLPFYNLLLYYFIETTCKRAQYHAERAVRNLVIVLRTLDLTPGLIDLMKDAEEAYSIHLNESSTYGQPASPMAELMPLLASQMESWEFRQDGKLPEFRLFSSLRVKKMLHALLIRVESDVQHKLPSAVSERYRTFLKDYVKRIFGYEVSESSLRSLEEQQMGVIQGMGNGKAWCLPKYSWTDVSYRGDPMERPICSNEVGFLVRILVHWSVWINRRLGLDGQKKTGDKGAELHWLLLVLQQWACRHQIRINLRPLAEASRTTLASRQGRTKGSILGFPVPAILASLQENFSNAVFVYEPSSSERSLFVYSFCCCLARNLLYCSFAYSLLSPSQSIIPPLHLKSAAASLRRKYSEALASGVSMEIGIDFDCPLRLASRRNTVEKTKENRRRPKACRSFGRTFIAFRAVDSDTMHRRTASKTSCSDPRTFPILPKPVSIAPRRPFLAFSCFRNALPSCVGPAGRVGIVPFRFRKRKGNRSHLFLGTIGFHPFAEPDPCPFLGSKRSLSLFLPRRGIIPRSGCDRPSRSYRSFGSRSSWNGSYASHPLHPSRLSSDGPRICFFFGRMGRWGRRSRKVTDVDAFLPHDSTWHHPPSHPCANTRMTRSVGMATSPPIRPGVGIWFSLFVRFGMRRRPLSHLSLKRCSSQNRAQFRNLSCVEGSNASETMQFESMHEVSRTSKGADGPNHQGRHVGATRNVGTPKASKPRNSNDGRSGRGGPPIEDLFLSRTRREEARSGSLPQAIRWCGSDALVVRSEDVRRQGIDPSILSLSVQSRIPSDRSFSSFRSDLPLGSRFRSDYSSIDRMGFRSHFPFSWVRTKRTRVEVGMYGTWEGGLPKDMSTEEADEYFGRVWRISCTKRSLANPTEDECEGCARCGWIEGGVAAEGVLCECRYLHCYAGRDAVIVKMRKRLIYEGGRSGSPSRPHVVELTATAHRREDRSTGRQRWELGDTAYRMPRQLSVGQMMDVRLADLNLSTGNLETGW